MWNSRAIHYQNQDLLLLSTSHLACEVERYSSALVRIISTTASNKPPKN